MRRTTVILDEINRFLTSDSSMQRQYKTSWRGKGSYPRSAIPKLLDILTYYFKQEAVLSFSDELYDYSHLHTLVSQFTDALNSAHLEDVLYFSAQSMIINTKKIYVAAILKKILTCDFSKIEEHDFIDVMKSLARVLSRYDPSYIVDSPVLNEIYSEDCVGPYFDFTHFRQKCLPLLRKVEQADCHTDIISQLDNFLAKFRKDENFSKEIIDELRVIYQYRWNKIKGTELDYTRCQHVKKQDDKKQVVKNFWIAVAQMMCGAKLIESGYYSFLMPSIKYKKVYATGEPLEYYPISHFILSESADRLLSLDASLEYFDENPNEGVFCNREVWPVKDFSAVEKARVQFAAIRFSGRPELLKRNLKCPPIQRSTVNIVYELLISSMRKPITIDEMQIAYLTFWKSIRELDADERERLYSQRVVWNGRDYSIADLLGKIALGDVSEACISIWSIYLLKFVIDYRPEAYLSPEIDCVRVQSMREQSAKKEFCESEADIVKRNEMLMVSLLTYPFEQYFSSNYKLSFLGCLNNCDNTLQPFFLRLKSIIENNLKIDVFREIMSQMVLPRLLQIEQSKLPEGVESWLKLIRDENYLSKSNLCVDPKTLFCVLSTFEVDTSSQLALKSFLNDLIKILALKKNESMINILVNVKLKHLLSKLPETLQDKIKAILTNNEKPILNQDFIKSLYSYIAEKEKVSKHGSIKDLSFFASSSRQHEIIQPDLSGLSSVEDVLSFIQNEKVPFGKENHTRSNLLQRMS